MFTNDKVAPIDGNDGAAASWRKAAPPVLAPATTTDQALSEIVLNCVDHLRSNEACVFARAHEEGVHQMRVAIRRLRSCLSLFRDLIPNEQRKHINRELRWLIGEFGPARDWDVFLGEVLGPVITDLPSEQELALLRHSAERYRDKGYEMAQSALRSPRYVGLVMLVRAWGEGRSWHDENSPEAQEKMRGPARDVAHDLLEQHNRAVISAGQDFGSLSDEQRHELRIEIKKMRYATEFFRSLYAKQKSVAFVNALKTLQDDLGANNDIAVARELLASLTKDGKGKRRAQLGYAKGLVLGWHSHVTNGREENLTKIWEGYITKRPFWDTSTAASASSVLQFVVPNELPVAEPEKEAAPVPKDESETGSS